MFRLISIEREYGCGAPVIAEQLARHLGWKLWDRLLTEEIARVANVETSAVKRCEEKMDGRLYRLAKSFWRGSHDRHAPLGTQAFDADCMMDLVQEILNRVADEGNAVVVGRGAPYLLRERPDTFHVFLFAPRAEKIRRLGEENHSQEEAEDLVETIDRDRAAYIKHYFNADWPTRSLYHVMLNTAVGDQAVISTVLTTMHLVEGRPKATAFDISRVPAER